MTAQAILPTSAALDASRRRDEMVAFLIMAVLFAAAPLAVYPFFMMQARVLEQHGTDDKTS